MVAQACDLRPGVQDRGCVYIPVPTDPGARVSPTPCDPKVLKNGPCRSAISILATGSLVCEVSGETTQRELSHGAAGQGTPWKSDDETRHESFTMAPNKSSQRNEI